MQTSITLITTGPSISYPYPYRPSYPSSGKVSKHIVRLRTQRLPQPQRSKGLSREGGQGTGGGRTEGPRRLATTNILQQLLQRVRVEAGQIRRR